MLSIRNWSVRHARYFEWFYEKFEGVLLVLHPVFERFGYQRLEQPISILEKTTKGFLFDCQMCGQCILSSTGMSCPMNCPKELRNGPCGGVRLDGNCEVKPEMPCVWVAAWHGNSSMLRRDNILKGQAQLDRRQQNTSSWLRVVKQKQLLSK